MTDLAQSHLSQRPLTKTEDTEDDGSLDKIIDNLVEFLKKAKFGETDKKGVDLCEDERLLNASKTLITVLGVRAKVKVNVVRIQGGNNAQLITSSPADLIPLLAKNSKPPMISGIALSRKTITHISETVEVQPKDKDKSLFYLLYLLYSVPVTEESRKMKD